MFFCFVFSFVFFFLETKSKHFKKLRTAKNYNWALFEKNKQTKNILENLLHVWWAEVVDRFVCVSFSA